MRNYNCNSMDLFPRMAVGVMGSAEGHLAPEICAQVERLGSLVVECDHVLFIVAAPGLPQYAVLGAKRKGVVAASPVLNLE